MEAGWPLRTSMLENWKAIASKMINDMNVCNLYNSGNPPALKVPKMDSSYTYNFGTPLPRSVSNSNSITLCSLVDFVSHLVMPEMGVDIAQHFCLKFGLETTELIPAEEMHELWVPFLQDLVPLLETGSIPLSTPMFQQMFTAILTSYITKYVGAQPSKETNLVRPAVRCSQPRCADCVSLNRFLCDPNQKVGRFTMNEMRRNHLSSKLCSGECSTNTERRGSPYTLVVTKTFAKNDQERRMWTSRKGKAEKMLKTFNQTKLRMLLGDSYNSIRRFEVLTQACSTVSTKRPKVSPSRLLVPNSLDPMSRDLPSSSGQLPRSSSISLPPIIGVKRKVTEGDVIDLTGED